ncbi:NAD(P)-binding protein [Ceratobasidium sp. AG-I]|nr:NAD(P)-binding protein [Ceratobasidium sp. AG-I]
MPYSEKAHSRPVAATLASISNLRTNIDNLFMPLHRDMVVPRIDLHGKLAIVTGANSGIGFEVARALAGLGARVVLACRSEPKGEEAMRKIVELTGSKSVEIEVLDCGSFKSVRAFLERWEKRELKQIDILINNAGGMTSTLAVTEDGFEQTYQANHLSHVLLTHTLLNSGRFTHDARIVSVSSVGFYSSDPLDEHNVDCSVVKSEIWNQPAGAGSMTGFVAVAFKKMANTLGISPEQGAVVPVWLAVAPEPATPKLKGMYWDRLRWKWVRAWSMEAERQEKLWKKWCEDAGVSLI